MPEICTFLSMPIFIGMNHCYRKFIEKRQSVINDIIKTNVTEHSLKPYDLCPWTFSFQSTLVLYKSETL